MHLQACNKEMSLFAPFICLQVIYPREDGTAGWQRSFPLTTHKCRVTEWPGLIKFGRAGNMVRRGLKGEVALGGAQTPINKNQLSM